MSHINMFQIKREKLKGLYVITDKNLTPYREGKIYKMVESALKGGAKIVQLRDKETSLKELIPIAFALKTLCHEYGALFLINDYIELAKETQADGVHLGREDPPLEIALKEIPDKIIGVSCYGDLSRALLAEKLGASYVAFGSFYPSPTKPTAPTIPLEIISKAKKVLRIPICTIGGITLEKASSLIELGADMVAVISDIWKADSIEERAKTYKNLFEKDI